MGSSRMNLGGPLSWLEIMALPFKSFMGDDKKPKKVRTLAALPRDLRLVPSSLVGQ